MCLCIYVHMPAYPRKSIIPGGEDCVVHTVSRCVRRAFLCEEDRYTGISYEHRRDWVRDRIRRLAESFAIEVCGYAVMSNHCHLVLWCRPALADTWPAEEVARRWTHVYHTKDVDEARIAALAKDDATIAKWRARLGSVSWFMRGLNEWISRKANAEDKCTGTFWEGRFRSQLLADDGAVLACMAYVDLNPVRAKMAKSLEESEFTSIFDRLTGYQARQQLAGIDGLTDPTPEQREMLGLAREQASIDAWLCPMSEKSQDDKTQDSREEDEETGKRDGSLASGRHTVLDIRLESYLELVEWTGRQIAEGNPGMLPDGECGVVATTGMDAAAWVETVMAFGRKFSPVVGHTSGLRHPVRRRGQSRAGRTTATTSMCEASAGG